MCITDEMLHDIDTSIIIITTSMKSADATPRYSTSTHTNDSNDDDVSFIPSVIL